MVAEPIDMNADLWQVSRSGTPYGPYKASVIKSWIETGQLAPDVTISQSSGGPAMTLTEFLQLLNGESPTPSPGIQSAEDREIVLEEEVETIFHRTAPRTGQAAPPPIPASDGMTQAQTHYNMVMATPDDAAPVRDRVVMLGRRQSGKTVYLASLYAALWKSLDGATAKALSGTGHRELMAVAQTLKEGRWPHATQASLQVEWEVEYKGRKRLMVTLDFAGELFSKAFLHDQGNAAEVRPLMNHIDHAAAVMLLVDPGVAVGQDPGAIMEDDFGLVQAVQRIRNWPGGEQVPIVFILTKADMHQEILDRFGGPVGFVRAHFPALVRLMKQVPIFQISAVQCTRDPSGALLPRPDSVSVNVEKPLLYCLNLIDAADREAEKRREREDKERAIAQYEQQQAIVEKKQVRLLSVAVIFIFLLGAAAVALIIIYKF